MYTMERPVRKLMASLQGSSLEKSDESNYKDRIFNREPCPQERKTICTNRRQLKVFSFPPTGKYIITVKLTRQNLSYKTTTVGFFQGHTGKLSCTEPLTTHKHFVNTHTCQSTSTHLSNKIQNNCMTQIRKHTNLLIYEALQFCKQLVEQVNHNSPTYKSVQSIILCKFSHLVL